MRIHSVLFVFFLAASAHAATSTTAPSTTNNDDTCDISVMPAATLLLPYFEVDINSPQTTARTTLFTVYNTTQRPQIAHVTIWTDLAFPVVDFNLFLTGYDVQAINLYDVVARGVVAPSYGTSNTADPGSRSLDNDANTNFLPSAHATCSVLPGRIPPSILADIRNGLTTGTYSTCGTVRIGQKHDMATGYVTIDLTATCSITLPTDPTYYSDELLFDNVLGGDSMQINPNPTTGNYAGGNPLVHIRAVPEGGAAGSKVRTNLPYTFYDRFTPRDGDRTRDRRQPLPSTFAARYIQGGPGAFNTSFKIWREGITGPNVACSAYSANNGTRTQVLEMVRFDEHENPTIWASNFGISPPPAIIIVLPATSSTPTSSNVYPALSTSGDVGGWIYMNLSNGGSPEYSVTTDGVSVNLSTNPRPPNERVFISTAGIRQSQNWVTVSMFAEGRYSVDFDALVMANGCTPAPAKGATIEPGGNGTP